MVHHGQGMNSDAIRRSKQSVHKNYFHSNWSDFQFIGWNINTADCFVLAILLALLLVLLHEVIIFSLHVDVYILGQPKLSKRQVIFIQVRRSLLHMLRVGFTMMVMLSLMTYNIWFLLTQALGSGLGYFILRPLILTLLTKWLKRKRKTSTRHKGKADIKLQDLTLTRTDSPVYKGAKHKPGDILNAKPLLMDKLQNELI
ncbi:protein SLC31A2-like [Physella acuta]|uniref:protein SLC31A2-like n=1 Tax=Physella acuta TaxID=109671 RepID=UPI0027DB08EC|nr:protein SLC31A2-like [Physella acuta]